VNDNATTSAVFGPVVTDGAPFSIQMQVTDQDGDNLSFLGFGTLPAGVLNLMVTPLTSGNPATFMISGFVDYILNGTTIAIPFTVSDDASPLFGGPGIVTGSFNVAVTPEPASVALAGLVWPLVMRRHVACK
jgi:hypothetical protein